jgi:hypothetical protein
LRQTGSDDRDRQLQLGHPVHRCRDRLHLHATEELHLVNEEDDACVVAASRLAELNEQLDEVSLEVACASADRVRVEGELEAAVHAYAGLEARE